MSSWLGVRPGRCASACRSGGYSVPRTSTFSLPAVAAWAGAGEQVLERMLVQLSHTPGPRQVQVSRCSQPQLRDVTFLTRARDVDAGLGLLLPAQLFLLTAAFLRLWCGGGCLLGLWLRRVPEAPARRCSLVQPTSRRESSARYPLCKSALSGCPHLVNRCARLSSSSPLLHWCGVRCSPWSFVHPRPTLKSPFGNRRYTC